MGIGAQPLVVLTKADLVPDPATLGHLVQDVETTAPGVRVLTVSSLTGEGTDVLAAVVGGGTSVLLGISGAGKSTLANTLLGADVMEVQEAREVDGKGRHTTTTRNLLALPGGGVLIDTPGLRGVGLWDAGTGVGQVFSEIEEYAESCRFHDCAHEAEPGCAVRAAVDSESCRSGAWTATASCCARTSGSSRRRTRGSGRRSAVTGGSSRRRAAPTTPRSGPAGPRTP